MATKKTKAVAKKSGKPAARGAEDSGFITIVGRSEDQKLDRNIVLSDEIIKISDYLYERKVKTSTVRENVHKFLVSIGDIVAEAPQAFGDYSLHEIEVSAELTLSGEVKLWGIGGAEVEGKAGITFKIRRGKANGSE